MRIPTYSPSLYPADNLRRAADLFADPQPHPRRRPSNQPLAERVVEGEILPRPPAVQSLLTDYRANILTQTANRAVPGSTETSHQAAPSQMLFYLLHSSNENLSGTDIGRRIDQRV